MEYYTEKKLDESQSHRPAMSESYKHKIEWKRRLLETSYSMMSFFKNSKSNKIKQYI